jgi:hypothetical protein
MALYIFDQGVGYLLDPRGFGSWYGSRIIDETREQLIEINQRVSPELQVLFDFFQQPHVLSDAEKSQLLLALINYARTLVVDRSHEFFGLSEVYGTFSRETNGTIQASNENSLGRLMLIKKVFILSMILSSRRIRDSRGLVAMHRVMVQRMMPTDQTLQPLLALLHDEGASVELMMTTFGQLFIEERLSAQG